MKEIAEIREELRGLCYRERLLDDALALRERHLARIALLRRGGETEETRERIAALERAAAELRIDEHIATLCRLQTTYAAVLPCFSGVDGVILAEGLIGGKSYEELGRSLHYSREGIRKRSRRILVQIARRLDEQERAESVPPCPASVVVE